MSDKDQFPVRFGRQTHCVAHGARPLSQGEMAAGIARQDDLPRLPKTRAACLPGGSNAARPCPFVSCRHHLLLDVNHLGSLWLNQPLESLDDGSCGDSCSLDVAARGTHTLEGVAAQFHVTRERVRQIENGAMAHLRDLLARDQLRAMDQESDELAAWPLPEVAWSCEVAGGCGSCRQCRARIKGARGE